MNLARTSRKRQNPKHQIRESTLTGLMLLEMSKLSLEDTTPFPRLRLGKAAPKRNCNSKHENKLQNIDKILSILRR